MYIGWCRHFRLIHWLRYAQAFPSVEQCARSQNTIENSTKDIESEQCNALVRLLNWVKGDCMAYLIFDLHKAS